MKWNVICNAKDRFSCVRALFARASHVKASMHRNASLELLRQPGGCSKNTNDVFTSNEENARPHMLKSFFLSERKLLNAILRVKLKYMKYVSFSLNEMLFAMHKTDIHVLELFCRASHVRASIYKIASLELLRTLMLCLLQMKRMQGHRCWKASFSGRESCLMQF